MATERTSGGVAVKPKTINGFGFARDAGHLELSFAVNEFGRLADLLVTAEGCNSGQVQAKIAGVRDGNMRSFLDLSIRARLDLQCQRCLRAVPIELDFRKRLELVRSESDISDDELEDEQVDAVVACREMSVMDLVEDEILLALPMVARHDACEFPEA